jgi:hypothetical protein
MMPERTRVESVNIYTDSDDGMVQGFRFYNGDKCVFEIGKLRGGNYMTDITDHFTKVVLADNEVVIGVVCKLYPGEQSVYSHFQLQIATRFN